MKFDTITITDWGQLLELAPESNGWVYRGQSDASWNLESSLRRTVLNNQIGYIFVDNNFAFAERMSLRSFKSRSHFYLNHLPGSDDLVAWLAVMQHHGAPTRLVDFSFSLYVAIYFALIGATKEACVWAIDENWLRSEGTTYATSMGYKPSNNLRFGQLASICRTANHIISKNNFDSEDEPEAAPSVLMVEIERQIPRLAIQQGLFLIPTNLEKPFIANLESMSGGETDSRKTIRKIVFPLAIRCHALMHLRMMNITAETLFPGVDGFAASLIQQDML